MLVEAVHRPARAHDEGRFVAAIAIFDRAHRQVENAGKDGDEHLRRIVARQFPVDALHDLSGRSAGHGMRLEQRSEEHTSELQSLMRISYAVFCVKKKTKCTL